MTEAARSAQQPRTEKRCRICGQAHWRAPAGWIADHTSEPIDVPIEAEAAKRGGLDVAWKEVADAVVDRPYPGTDTNGGWCIQLFGYPPTSIGGTPETRYHAMATPAIDSHHRNTVKATGPTPTAALQALLTAFSSQSPVSSEESP